MAKGEKRGLSASIPQPHHAVARLQLHDTLPARRPALQRRLEMLEAYGKDKVCKLAEIVAATVLAGELSPVATRRGFFLIIMIRDNDELCLE